MIFRPLLGLAILVGYIGLVSSYRYDIVLNVVGDRSLIEKASNAFLANHVRKANGLKHLEDVNFVFKNLSASPGIQPAGICNELFADGNQKVDLLLQIVDDRDDLQSGELRSLAKRSNQPMIAIKKENAIREWESMSFEEYNSLIHFKPIESVLSTVVRDLILRENLQSAAVLMDSSFGNQTLNIVEDLSFTKIETMVDCQDHSIDDWKAKLIALRRMKIGNYFVLATPFTINKFLEAFNQQQMFSKYVKVYAITLGNGKIRCISCKHATFYIVRPLPTKLHDYESNENLFQADAKNRIRLYFYFDLFRLITTTVDRHLKLMKEVNSKNRLPVLDRAKCERHFRVQPTHSLPDDPVIAAGGNLPINNFDLSQNDLTENDPTTFSFRTLLAKQTEELYGFYGDFKLHTDAITYGYQDIAMRIEQESYLRQQVSRESYAEWSFDEKEGNIFFNAHLLEDEGESQEVAKGENKAASEEAKPAAGGEEAPKSEESKGDSGGGEEAKASGEAKAEESGEAKGEETAGEDGGGGDKKPKDSRVTIFLVEHPPFIMKRIIDRSKELASTTTTTTTTTTAAPKGDGEEKEEEQEEPEEEEKKTEYEYYGFLIDLFEMIKEELVSKQTPFPEYRFEEIEITKDSDKMFYGGDRKTDFSGMVKKMNETETDSFALAPLAITASREFLLEFSSPYFQNVGISILMKKPRRKPHFFKFITVLESKVWACITGAYLFTSILLAIFDQFNPQSYKKKKEAKMMLKNQPNEKTEEQDEYEALTTNRIFTFKESLWFCITSLTPQGGGEAPRSLYGRLVAATWWLFGFIVIASYTANLAAFLTVSRLETKIDDLKKLSKQYKVRYAPVDDTATDFYFIQNAEIEEKFYEIWKDMSLNDSLSEDDRAKLAVWDYPVSDRYTKIASQMSESDKPKGITNALKRVRESADHSDGFAILADSLTVEYFSYLFCDIYQVGESFAPRPMALGAKKTNSIDIMKLINPVIVRLEEQGIIEDLKAKYWYNNDNRRNCEEFRKLSNGISLLNSGGVFIVIINGVILTLFVLMLENFIVVHMKVNRAKKQKAAVKPPLMMNGGKANSGCFKSFTRFFTGRT